MNFRPDRSYANDRLVVRMGTGFGVMKRPVTNLALLEECSPKKNVSNTGGGCYRRRTVIFLSLIGLTLCGHYMKYLVENFVTRMKNTCFSLVVLSFEKTGWTCGINYG